VIEQLKAKAAQLGANGVIIEGFSDSQTGSVGTGVGSSSYGGSSASSVGVGGSLGIYKKTGQGTAIFVPPSPAGSVAPPATAPPMGSPPPPGTAAPSPAP
jgi:hypothetical protein